MHSFFLTVAIFAVTLVQAETHPAQHDRLIRRCDNDTSSSGHISAHPYPYPWNRPSYTASSTTVISAYNISRPAPSGTISKVSPSSSAANSTTGNPSETSIPSKATSPAITDSAAVSSTTALPGEANSTATSLTPTILPGPSSSTTTPPIGTISGRNVTATNSSPSRGFSITFFAPRPPFSSSAHLNGSLSTTAIPGSSGFMSSSMSVGANETSLPVTGPFPKSSSTSALPSNSSLSGISTVAPSAGPPSSSPCCSPRWTNSTSIGPAETGATEKSNLPSWMPTATSPVFSSGLAVSSSSSMTVESTSRLPAETSFASWNSTTTIGGSLVIPSNTPTSLPISLWSTFPASSPNVSSTHSAGPFINSTITSSSANTTAAGPTDTSGASSTTVPFSSSPATSSLLSNSSSSPPHTTLAGPPITPTSTSSTISNTAGSLDNGTTTGLALPSAAPNSSSNATSTNCTTHVHPTGWPPRSTTFSTIPYPANRTSWLSWTTSNATAMPSGPSTLTGHEEIAKLDHEVAEQNDEISNLNQKIKTLLDWINWLTSGKQGAAPGSGGQ